MPLTTGTDTITLAQNGIIVVTDDGSDFSAELCSNLTAKGHRCLADKLAEVIPGLL